MTGSSVYKFITVVGCAAFLAGCSMGGLLSGKRGIPDDGGPAVSTGNQLAMPPDLSLAAPGTAPARAAVADDNIDTLDGPAPAAPGQMTRKQQALASANPQGDIYEQYGISKFHADGRKKEDWELREELRKAIIARKRKANPGYGTIMNMGGLFSDN